MNNKRKKILCIVVMLISVIGIGATVIHAKNNIQNIANTSNSVSVTKVERREKPEKTEESVNVKNEDTKTKEAIEVKEDTNLEENTVVKVDTKTEKKTKVKDKTQSEDTTEDTIKGETRKQKVDGHKGSKHKNNVDVNQLGAGYAAIICVFASTFSLSLVYLIMSRKDEQFFKNGDKLLISIAAAVILTVGITAATAVFADEVILKDTQTTIEQTTEESDAEQTTEESVEEETTGVANADEETMNEAEQ
jgi:hypothetical protein